MRKRERRSTSKCNCRLQLTDTFEVISVTKEKKEKEEPFIAIKDLCMKQFNSFELPFLGDIKRQFLVRHKVML